MRVRLRPTLPADIAAVFPDRRPPLRLRAITAELDGIVLGVGGIGYRADGTVVAFAQITPAGRRYPAAIHRAGRAAMAMIEASGVPEVIAEAQPDNRAAVRWLLRLGFAPEGAAFVWRRPTDVPRAI